MDTFTNKQIELHFETLPRAAKRALDFLSTQNWLKNTNWYLAGGTALALQAGNRLSVDLDFFTEQKKYYKFAVKIVCFKR